MKNYLNKNVKCKNTKSKNKYLHISKYLIRIKNETPGGIGEKLMKIIQPKYTVY